MRSPETPKRHEDQTVPGSASGVPAKTGLFALNTTGIDPWPPASDRAAQDCPGWGWGGGRAGREERGKGKQSTHILA